MIHRLRLRLGGQLVRALTRASMRWPRATLGIWAAFITASALVATGLQFETSISSFLDVRGEEWRIYQDSLERHGGDEFVAVVLRSEAAFDASTLREVVELSAALEDLEGVARVDSLATGALIRPGVDGSVDLSAPLEDGVPDNPAELASLRAALQRDRIAPGAWMSRDERAFALNVILDEDVLGDRDQVVREIEELAGEDALVSGVPVFRTRINGDTQRETFLLTPLTVSLMAAILFWAFRSPIAAILPLTVGGLGTIATVGLLAATGTPLSLSTMILPSVLLALGCAYAMHIVSAASGAKSRDELEQRMLLVAIPVALSGLTTTLGFLGISTTSITSIRELSLYGAYGVLVVTAASVSLVPAVLALRPVLALPETAAQAWMRGPLAERFATVASDHPKRVLVAWGLLSLFAIAGVMRLEVSTDIIRWYSPDAPVRQEYREIREALSGISPVSLYVEATGERGVTEPDVVAALDRLATELEARDDVGKVLSIGDPLRMMRAALEGGEPVLPETRAETEQYLLLLESEEPVWDVMSRDRRTARLALRVDDNRSDAIVSLAGDAEQWWEQNGPADFRATGTGIMLEFARSNQAIVRTQIAGLALALGGVGFVLWVLMGSLGRSFIALVPNLIPILVAYGAMGFVGAPLDSATACLGSLALGIAIDDTVHVAAAWTRARDRGLSAHAAIHAGLPTVMPALLLSSVSIAIGFGALGLSELLLIRNLGLVTAGVVGICWAADVTLLPVSPCPSAP